MLLPRTVLMAQCEPLVEAQKYAPSDRLLIMLLLHHIHRVVNAFLAPFAAGSSVEFLAPLIAKAVWSASRRRLFRTTTSKPPSMPTTAATMTMCSYNRSSIGNGIGSGKGSGNCHGNGSGSDNDSSYPVPPPL